jgi:hypothetical protein
MLCKMNEKGGQQNQNDIRMTGGMSQDEGYVEGVGTCACL